MNKLTTLNFVDQIYRDFANTKNFGNVNYEKLWFRVRRLKLLSASDFNVNFEI